MEEMYCYSTRVVGVRSAIRAVRTALGRGQALFRNGEPDISIELAMNLAANKLRLAKREIPLLGIEGVIGGGARVAISE